MPITRTAARPRPGSTESVLLDALRSNLSLLGELAARYEVSVAPERARTPRPVLSAPDAVHALLGPEMARLAQEQLRVALLDTRNRVAGVRVIYQGSVNAVSVRPAEVFRPAVETGVPNIIVAHNHPSGDPTPSAEDIALTRDLVHQAGKLLGIGLHDHVVIGADGYVSLKERGLLTERS